MRSLNGILCSYLVTLRWNSSFTIFLFSLSSSGVRNILVQNQIRRIGDPKGVDSWAVYWRRHLWTLAILRSWRRWLYSAIQFVRSQRQLYSQNRQGGDLQHRVLRSFQTEVRRGKILNTEPKANRDTHTRSAKFHSRSVHSSAPAR